MRHKLGISWTTSDGEKFTTEEAAVYHQQMIEFAEDLVKEADIVLDSDRLTEVLELAVAKGWIIIPHLK